MLKFIVEDKETGGWNILIDLIMSKVTIDYEIINCDGFKNVLKYVESCEFSSIHNYVIIMDCVYNNNIVMDYYNQVKRIIGNYNNAMMIEFLCFEQIILEFRDIIKWVRPIKKSKEFDKYVYLMNKFIMVVNEYEDWYKDVELLDFMVNEINKGCKYIIKDREFIKLREDGRYGKRISSEKVAYSILNKLTEHSLFKYEKDNFVYCWYGSCCNRVNFEYNEVLDNCNMINYKLNSDEKLYCLYFGTSLNKYFDEIFKFIGYKAVNIFKKDIEFSQCFNVLVIEN